MRGWRALALALLLAASGCDRSTSLPAGASAYAEALAAVAAAADLQVSLPAPPAREPLRYPSSRELTVEIASDNLNLIEFLRLSRCDLHRVIAAHNSALSRVQDQVETLFYAAQFIAAAESCLAGGSGGGLMDKLAEARRHKRAAMPDYLHNAIFASRELRQFFSPYADLGDFNAVDSAAVAAAVTELGALAQALPQASPEFAFDAARSRFDIALGRLAEHRHAGAIVFYGHWLLALAASGAELERALVARQRCDLVERLRAPALALAAEIERLQRAARVDELLTVAPVAAPLEELYLEPVWRPLVVALRDWSLPTAPESCVAKPQEPTHLRPANTIP